MPTMILMVLNDVDRLEDVMRAWQAAGAGGITTPGEQRRGSPVRPHRRPR